MTAATLAGKTPAAGLRPVNLQRDLGAIADLIELCFQGTLDESGLGAIREMRALSRTGPAVWLIGAVAQNRPVWSPGFVWLEDGRLVGNVAVQRSRRRGEWLIANVAVHPQFRRRGIGMALTRAAIDLAREHGGNTAILQVDADNQAAVRLYLGLGFRKETSRTQWSRPPGRPPEAEPSEWRLRLRNAGEWEAEYELASLAMPHGLAWNRPLARDDFRPTLARRLGRFFSGEREEHWLALAPDPEAPGESSHPFGALRFLTGDQGRDRLTLLVHPEHAGRVERALLIHGLRRLGRRPWAAELEYPTGRPEAEAAFKDLGFAPGRILAWMRAEL